MNLQTASTYPAQWLSTSDLANTRRKRRSQPPLLNVSEQTIWRWVKQGYFPNPNTLGAKPSGQQRRSQSSLSPLPQGGLQHDLC